WDAYKTINVKYVNQIICEKNIVDSSAMKKGQVLESDNTVNKREAIDSLVRKQIVQEITKESTPKNQKI
ncbi:MAG: cell division protein FtsQ, partial [Sphingobacteriales bacterium]